jgi:hypothetical protein
MGDERLHGRVVAVAVAQLDGEALGEVAGGDAARLEALDEGEHRLDHFRRGAPSRSAISRASRRGQIAGIVDAESMMMPGRSGARAPDRPQGRAGRTGGRASDFSAADEGLEIVVLPKLPPEPPWGPRR